MDKQLIEEFNKIYFSKKAIAKRVYNIDDVNEIWNNIIQKRKKTAINTDLQLKNKSEKIWYNCWDKIENLLRDIEDILTNDISKYIPKRYREKLKKDTELRQYKDIVNSNENVNEAELKNLFITCDFKCKNIDLNDILSVFNNDINNVEDIFRELNKYLLESKSHTLVKGAIVYYYLVNQDIDEVETIANISCYYYLKQSGYNTIYYQDVFKNLNIDRIKYKKALTESLEHDNDATYFIMYFLETLKQTVSTLNSEITNKFGKKIITDIIEVNNVEILNRQLSFVLDNIDNEKGVFTIIDYKEDANVVYETARTDLNNLITLGFFKISKSGKKFLYHLNDVGTIIDNLQYL